MTQHNYCGFRMFNRWNTSLSKVREIKTWSPEIRCLQWKLCNIQHESTWGWLKCSGHTCRSTTSLRISFSEHYYPCYHRPVLCSMNALSCSSAWACIFWSKVSGSCTLVSTGKRKDSRKASTWHEGVARQVDSRHTFPYTSNIVQQFHAILVYCIIVSTYFNIFQSWKPYYKDKRNQKHTRAHIMQSKLPPRTSPADASPLILEPLLLSPSGHSKHADAILSQGSVVAERQIACLRWHLARKQITTSGSWTILNFLDSASPKRSHREGPSISYSKTNQTNQNTLDLFDFLHLIHMSILFAEKVAFRVELVWQPQGSSAVHLRLPCVNRPDKTRQILLPIATKSSSQSFTD